MFLSRFKITIIPILPILFFGMNIHAGDEEISPEIIIEGYKKRIGASRYADVKSLYIEAKIEEKGFAYKLKLYKKRPDMLRQEIITDTRSVLQVYNNGEAWTTDVAGRKMPLNAKTKNHLKKIYPIEPLLMTIPIEKFKSALKSDKEGMWKLTAAYQSSDYVFWLNEKFEIEKYIERDGNMKIIYILSDYTLVDGIRHAFTIEQIVNLNNRQSSLVYNIEHIDFNIDIEDDFFEY